MIVKMTVIAKDGRGKNQIRIGDRLVSRSDGKFDKRRLPKHLHGTVVCSALEIVDAGVERIISVHFAE